VGNTHTRNKTYQYDSSRHEHGLESERNMPVIVAVIVAVVIGTAVRIHCHVLVVAQILLKVDYIESLALESCLEPEIAMW
jgi:hypothetical protein